MFRKEAKTLTKLHHQALVEYRVLAQEPRAPRPLHRHRLSSRAPVSAPSLGDARSRPPDELAALLRRLAAGLAAAHQLGAVHRDMSPDNVILEHDDIDQAKIIDFGIAKDLDASSATIVGDGFAGKLNYVAPEQLGDFGREIGPWTDVYSLGLVILAVAQGKNVDMSGSLVDAIDKRRRGPDLVADPGRSAAAARRRCCGPIRRSGCARWTAVLAMLDGAAHAAGRPTVRGEPAARPVPGDTSTPAGGGAEGR